MPLFPEFVRVCCMNLIRPSRSALIVSFTIIALISCNITPNRLDTVYTDPQYFFRIEVPDTGWTISDATGIPNVLLVIKSNTPVNGFYPNVTISIESLIASMTEEEYGKKNQLLLLSQGFNLISTQLLIQHHTRVFEIICERADAETTLRFMYLCLVNNRIGYTITCITPEGSSEQKVRDLAIIARSFRFL